MSITTPRPAAPRLRQQLAESLLAASIAIDSADVGRVVTVV